jgi:hypothetical protein
LQGADHSTFVIHYGYREAFEFVPDVLEHGGLITEGLVREIHKRLVEGVRGGAAAGQYRRIQNYNL